MADQDLKLNDKVYIVTGNFNGSLCSLVSRLTELGADVTYLATESNEARRFCSNITDLKEVNPRYGRAVHVPLAFSLDSDLAENSIAKAVEVFGSIDGFVDMNLYDVDLPYAAKPSQSQLDTYLKTLEKTSTLATAALKFLKGRNRGKLVIACHKLDDEALKHTQLDEKLPHVLQKIKDSTHGFNVAINVLKMGLSEEYLLKVHPSKTVQEALDIFKADFKNAQISDGAHLANITCLLLSPFSNGVNGQIINIDFGSLS